MVEIDLTGKIAFVTGGTRGIGLAIARALHGAGAKVALAGRDLARARAAAAELGDRAMAVGCDVSVAQQVEAAIAAAEQALGPIDILVNNAGLTRDNILLRLTEADWDAVLDANLKGGVPYHPRGDQGDDEAAQRPDREHHQRGGAHRQDRKSTRLNSSHIQKSRMPSSA